MMTTGVSLLSVRNKLIDRVLYWREVDTNCIDKDTQINLVIILFCWNYPLGFSSDGCRKAIP